MAKNKTSKTQQCDRNEKK